MALFEVFFDGDCPLCAREIAFLRRLDRRSNVQFTDIAGASFDAERELGKSQEHLMAHIHGRILAGQGAGALVEGVEVFRRLYSAVGLGPLVALTRLPGISHLLDWAYGIFAKNRLSWTGRCADGACAIPDHAQAAAAGSTIDSASIRLPR